MFSRGMSSRGMSSRGLAPQELSGSRGADAQFHLGRAPRSHNSRDAGRFMRADVAIGTVVAVVPDLATLCPDATTKQTRDASVGRSSTTQQEQ